MTEDKKIPTLKYTNFSDIKYESYEEFHNSVLKNAYIKAYKLTHEIVESMEKMSSDFKENNGTKLRNKSQIYNIIFFTGDRGTGKTSAMLSYMEFLKDYYRRYKGKNMRDFVFEQGPYMFTGLDYIDASSLNDKEDILGSVLSKMLNKWKSEEERSRDGFGIVRKGDYDYKKRQIRILFNEVYDRLKDLRSSADIMEEDNDMFIETLERLSLSWNVKQSFQKLVEAYLDIMVYPGSENEIGRGNHFLVISIDDLDMNITNGFMLLEQIRKYLMVPHVIVLLSANYEQLEKICYNHYTKEFKYIEKRDGVQSYIDRLSREYLEKIVPVQRQISLTSGSKWEYFSKEKICIKFTETKKCESQEREQKEEELAALDDKGTLCELVSIYMNKYFKVRFRPQSTCIEYLAPDTLRELCRWVGQFRELQLLGCPKKENNITILENNMRWFWEMEFLRLSKKYLSVESQRIFETLDVLEPESQLMLIKNKLKDFMKLNSTNSVWQILIEAESFSLDTRCFSSLYQIYLTMKLSEGVNLIREGRQEKRDLIQQYYGYRTWGNWGIWGEWERQMLSPMSKTVAEAIYFARIAKSKFKKDKNCLVMSLKSGFNMGTKKGIKDFIENNKEKILNYQYLILFYHLNIGDEDDLWEIEKELKMKRKYEGEFSLTGFVLNVLEGSSLVKKFQSWLYNFLFGKGIFTEKEKKEICSKLFIKTTQEVLLPIDSTEIMLYIGKQMHGRLRSRIVSKLVEEEIKFQIYEYFHALIECLENIDQNCKISINEFKNYPVVKKIVDKDSEFMTLLAKNIIIHQETYIPSKIEQEWSGV